MHLFFQTFLGLFCMSDKLRRLPGQPSQPVGPCLVRQYSFFPNFLGENISDDHKSSGGVGTVYLEIH